jgi:DNA-binding response OmpR family regulator
MRIIYEGCIYDKDKYLEFPMLSYRIESVVNFNCHNPQEAAVAEPVKRLVYIEDEEEMIDLVRLILNRRGFEVLGANGGREGLEMVRRELPDLVLLDLMMPDMDGWDVYQQMKSDETTRLIPVIVVTAKAQSIDKVLGLHIAKVEDYISKPFSPQELLDSVDKVLSKRQSYGSSD